MRAIVMASLCTCALVACGGQEARDEADAGAPPADSGAHPAPDTTPIPLDTSPPDAGPPDVGCGGTSMRRLSAGGDATCALADDSTVHCWGAFDTFEWGKPKRIEGVDCASQVSVSPASGGSSHACALAGGSIWCWGNNATGALGDPSALSDGTPFHVPGIDTAVEIASGRDMTCARLADGTIRCWGNDIRGALGDGGSAVMGVPPVTVVGLTDADALFAGADSACARHASDGSYACWGMNDQGQLGRGFTTDADARTPVDVPSLAHATWIAWGTDSGYALMPDGSVLSWGYDYVGELGDGTLTPNLVPHAITALSGVVRVASCMQDPFAVDTKGALFEWGQVLVPPGKMVLSPKPFDALPGPAVDVAAGRAHACARVASGQVLCWGEDTSGQLGDGGGGRSDVPVAVTW